MIPSDLLDPKYRRTDRLQSAILALCMIVVVVINVIIWSGHRLGERVSARAPDASAGTAPCDYLAGVARSAQ